MRDRCRKCGKVLSKRNLILCDRYNKIFSKWSLRNVGKYSLEEIREFRRKWIKEGEELP